MKNAVTYTAAHGGAVRSCGYRLADTPYTARCLRTGLTIKLVPAPVRPSCLINTIGMLEKYATLALVARQGCIDLGVCLGRGLRSARGASEPEASEMPVYLSTR